MRLIPQERKLMTKSIKNANPLNVVAKVFGVSRTTAWCWKSETLNSNFENLSRNRQSKITKVCVQNFHLSRTSINNVLKKHKLNCYSKKHKTWKFFRAKYPNELGQVGLKEFKFEEKKYYILVCINDYSRFILCLKLFYHCPTTKDLTSALQKLNVNLLSKLKHWIHGKMEEWRIWFNDKRYHRGIKDCPSNLYVKL